MIRTIKNNAVLSGLVVTMLIGGIDAVLQRTGNASEKGLNDHQQNSLWFRVEQLEASNLSLSNGVYVLKNPPKKGKRP